MVIFNSYVKLPEGRPFSKYSKGHSNMDLPPKNKNKTNCSLSRVLDSWPPIGLCHCTLRFSGCGTTVELLVVARPMSSHVIPTKELP